MRQAVGRDEGLDRVMVALDLGGSCFRSALVTEDGGIVEGSPVESAVDSDGEAAEIVGAFVEGIGRQLGLARERGLRIEGIGVSTPGPFDYEAGTSLMDHKFASIKGIALGESMRRGCRGAEGIPLGFFHDIHAFLYGEHLYGAARGYRDVLAVSIGTGLGIGYLRNGVIAANGVGGPAYSIYRTPYRGSIVEEVVSRRGIIRRYGEIAGRGEAVDVREITQRGSNGEEAACAVFREIGEALAAVLGPCIDAWKIERLVFGGRIAGAFDLFAPVLRAGLARLIDGEALARGSDLDGSAIRGVAGLMRSPGAIRPADVAPVRSLV